MPLTWSLKVALRPVWCFCYSRENKKTHQHGEQWGRTQHKTQAKHVTVGQRASRGRHSGGGGEGGQNGEGEPVSQSPWLSKRVNHRDDSKAATRGLMYKTMIVCSYCCDMTWLGLVVLPAPVCLILYNDSFPKLVISPTDRYAITPVGRKR